jgi:hypothetical protein
VTRCACGLYLYAHAQMKCSQHPMEEVGS